MPVLPNYFASHQWLRELKRRGVKTFVGIHFRIPDEEPVLVGHYRHAHTAMSAVEAGKLIMDAADARGYEVIVARRIEADEIHSVRSVNRVVGWRYYPEAKGRKPFCRCRACNRGEIRATRLWAAEEEAQPRREAARERSGRQARSNNEMNLTKPAQDAVGEIRDADDSRGPRR